MKPKELTRKSPGHDSFSVSRHCLPHFLNVWHYHEEIELVYIRKSSGTKFIGDRIGKFQPGDLVVIGSQLPHLWLNDKPYFERRDLEAEAWVIHFHPTCLGESFFSMPEMKMVSKMLEDSKVGFKIGGMNKSRIIDSLELLLSTHDHQKVLLLLTILIQIAEEKNKRTLSSHSFIDAHSGTSGSRLDSVYRHIFNNFKHDISLEEIATLANMNPSSFSRYFKQVTNKTFSAFLNEIRVGYASKLILEQDKMNIAQIGFESGYNNLSNFNKQFKAITGMTPTQYYNAHVGVGI